MLQKWLQKASATGKPGEKADQGRPRSQRVGIVMHLGKILEQEDMESLPPAEENQSMWNNYWQAPHRLYLCTENWLKTQFLSLILLASKAGPIASAHSWGILATGRLDPGALRTRLTLPRLCCFAFVYCPSLPAHMLPFGPSIPFRTAFTSFQLDVTGAPKRAWPRTLCLSLCQLLSLLCFLRIGGLVFSSILVNAGSASVCPFRELVLFDRF